jgi:hypothetical protein
MISSASKIAVVTLALIGYAGAVGIVWTSFADTCATVFILNMAVFTSLAVPFSLVAAVVQMFRMRWFTGEPPRSGRKLLLLAVAPALGVALYVVGALAIVSVSAPNRAVPADAAKGPPRG